MNQKGANILQFRGISEVAEEARVFIENRRSGKEQSLKVKSKKINETFMNGFDWNRIITIAGLSGSGKSTIARQ